MNRNYYVRYLFLIFAFATSQLIVLFAYNFLQTSSSLELLFPAALNCPNIESAAIILNESIAKEGIALDAENEKSIVFDTFLNETTIDESIIFIDDLPEFKAYYELDYTKSHPFENECRFPVLIHNDKDVQKYVGHYREIDCSKSKQQPPLVHQYRNGEILIGKPHRSSVAEFECFYMEISGALAPHKVKVDIGKKKKVNFQILYGYTKIGDNSAINLLGVLAGLVYGKEDDRGFKDLVEADSFFDLKKYDKDFGQHPETIISRAKEAGCMTMWNDEIANSGYGLYHYYDFKGFHEPIADYYYRPFYEYQYQKLAANSACDHGENIIPKWIGLWEEFSTKYSNHCHFSFNFFTGLTHASSNNLELYDIPVSDALVRMESTGVMENTFFLIMGDHGQRISPIKKSHIGRIEERMSMMGIHVPQKFRQEFPEKFNNLVINKNRLTSNFDIHETMEDIFDITLDAKHEHRKKHGISLFEKIPKNRTCAEAIIPEHFCCCMEKVEDERIKEAEPFIEPKLKDYLYLIFTNSCISTYSYEINPSKTAYTISEAARFGIRYPKEWRDLTDVAKKKIQRDLFEIEFSVGLNVTSKTNPTSIIQGNLLVRMQYNANLKFLQLNASPMLNLSTCTNIFVIEEICGCFV
uniref:Uncharacterized protein n=1 Tax=Panagrolaimus sp. ES5 TaxID=591445 RepID=A0AC34GRS5_9BILA